jgi:hypothetical protein
MNTIDLLNILPRALDKSARFMGVFAADEAPAWSSLQPRSCYVMNTDPGDQEGEHWLAVYKPTDGPPELFDSFALPLTRYKSVPALADAPPGLRITPRALQSPFSYVCGHYCVYYLYYRTRGSTLDRIVRFLASRPSRDTIVREFVKRLRSQTGGRATYSMRNRPARIQCCCSLLMSYRLRAAAH